MRRAHEIDFQVFGDDMQFVEISLDPGETVVAEAGGMMTWTVPFSQIRYLVTVRTGIKVKALWIRLWEPENGCLQEKAYL